MSLERIKNEGSWIQSCANKIEEWTGRKPNAMAGGGIGGMLGTVLFDTFAKNKSFQPLARKIMLGGLTGAVVQGLFTGYEKISDGSISSPSDLPRAASDFMADIAIAGGSAAVGTWVGGLAGTLVSPGVGTVVCGVVGFTVGSAVDVAIHSAIKYFKDEW